MDVTLTASRALGESRCRSGVKMNLAAAITVGWSQVQSLWAPFLVLMGLADRSNFVTLQLKCRLTNFYGIQLARGEMLICRGASGLTSGKTGYSEIPWLAGSTIAECISRGDRIDPWDDDSAVPSGTSVIHQPATFVPAGGRKTAVPGVASAVTPSPHLVSHQWRGSAEQTVYLGPQSLTTVAMPFWPLTALAALPCTAGLLLCARIYIARHRSAAIDPTKCSTCGYDLRASSDICPECGTRIPGTL